MRSILRYNHRFYSFTLAGTAAAALIASQTPPGWRAPLWACVGVALYWVCSSLAVSHYVYDRSPLCQMRWLADCLSRPPRRWLSIHAGLDGAGRALYELFPSAQGSVLDIYDSQEMTEPSIAAARRIHSAGQEQSTPADWRALPIADHAVDAVFLIFAAHELRRQEARAQFFREVGRVLRMPSPHEDGGELVLVEHLRDWKNFLAFGPGFLHFFSRRSWRRAASAAGLEVRAERAVTPFVRVFVLGRTA